MTARSFLISGLIAGLVGGLFAFVVAVTFGEPPIDQAIAVEEAASAAAEHDHSHDEGEGAHSHGDEEGGITRGQQAGPGLATATILFGTVLGGVTGIAAAFATGRLGRAKPGATAAIVSLLGFIAFALVPFLKYPPNPPAVGSGDTIGERTAQYFGLVAISIVAIIVAVLVARALLERGTLAAVAAGAAVYAVVVGIAFAVLPAIDEVPDSFPANTLYDFRIGSLLTQGALWIGIGVVLTALVGRAWKAESEAAARRELAASL